jgi:hypothetical protein
MGRKVILTEAQFKEYMRSVRKQLNENVGNERDLSVDEISALLHKMVDSDFACYFKNGKQFICSNLKDKAEIFNDVCASFPVIDTNGMIRLSNDKYGYYHITNLINSTL